MDYTGIPTIAGKMSPYTNQSTSLSLWLNFQLQLKSRRDAGWDFHTKGSLFSCWRYTFRIEISSCVHDCSSLGIFWTSEIIEMSHMFQNTDLVMIEKQWYIKYHLKWIHNRKFLTNIFAFEKMMFSSSRSTLMSDASWSYTSSKLHFGLFRGITWLG